ncbi:MAG: radical SAM protein, partial [bacterium]
MTVFSPAELTIEGHRPEAHEFDQAARDHLGHALHARGLHTIQINIGLTCNLACRHCHVESSPKRDEQMDWPTLEMVLDAAHCAGADGIDITGGAPEMNPHFRRFV